MAFTNAQLRKLYRWTLAGALVLATAPTAPAAAQSHAGLSAATNRELAAARRATAKYHDVEQAEADGYVNFNLYEPGEGYHWVNFSLVDDQFDPAHPEILLYAPVPGEERLQLVAVEYVLPLTEQPPHGFSGNADQWRRDTEEFGLWELTVWVWEHNPNGLFTYLNPRVP
jgi:hypothetical protein